MCSGQVNQFGTLVRTWPSPGRALTIAGGRRRRMPRGPLTPGPPVHAAYTRRAGRRAVKNGRLRSQNDWIKIL